MTESLDIEQIKQRLANAAPGPWEKSDANEGTMHLPMWCVTNDAFHNPPADENEPWLAVEIHTGMEADADFIAHAPDDIAALISEVEALRETLTSVESEVSKVYCDLTGGRISKVNTLASSVIAEAEAYNERTIAADAWDEGVNEGLGVDCIGDTHLNPYRLPSTDSEENSD